MSRPCLASSASDFTLSLMRALASFTAPPSRYGMPQQRWAGSETSTPFRSSTATVALPVAGSLKLTLHVAKRATLAWGGKEAGFRPAHHAEKVPPWERGGRRALRL